MVTFTPPAAGKPKQRGEDQVYRVARALRAEILAGALSPSQRLVEADLVERFKASRVVVRTAIYLLENEGLVEREQNRGARVRRIGQQEALEIASARAVIEVVLAREAAQHAGPDDIAALHETLAQMKAAHEAGDLFAMSRFNTTLHEIIHRAAQNQTLGNIVANLKHRLVNVQFSTMMIPGRADNSLGEHTALVAAIGSADPDMAEAAMREHMANVRSNLERSLSANQALTSATR